MESLGKTSQLGRGYNVKMDAKINTIRMGGQLS